MTNYIKEVISPGDQASGNFKKVCDEANKTLPTQEYFEQIGNSWKVKTGFSGANGVIESIDGVGTKTQIYTKQFENFIQEYNKSPETYKKGNKTLKKLIEQSTQLWERMLHDLIAMNIDDLRNGEVGVSVTNIVDINHLKGLRGKIFCESMSRALGNTIQELKIAITAGETAILGNGRTLNDILKIQDNFGNQLRDILEDKNDVHIDDTIKNKILELLSNKEKNEKMKLDEIEFNIGGTSLGIIGKTSKLVPLESGQSVIYFQEKPTKNGIIGARANGYTDIRNDLTKTFGDNWENKTFEECMEILGNKADTISKEVKEECSGLKMWDIATGKTTIFNTFVSQELLGGIKGNPIARISSLIHVTGNPKRKLEEGLQNKSNLLMTIDINYIKKPQIIEILNACGYKGYDETSNNGIPYCIICNAEDVEIIINKAEEKGFIARNIGNIEEREK